MSNYFESMINKANALKAGDLVKKRKLPKVESYHGAKREAPSYFEHVSSAVKASKPVKALVLSLGVAAMLAGAGTVKADTLDRIYGWDTVAKADDGSVQYDEKWDACSFTSRDAQQSYVCLGRVAHFKGPQAGTTDIVKFRIKASDCHQKYGEVEAIRLNGQEYFTTDASPWRF
jgi:hypothetical protein